MDPVPCKKVVSCKHAKRIFKQHQLGKLAQATLKHPFEEVGWAKLTELLKHSKIERKNALDSLAPAARTLVRIHSPNPRESISPLAPHLLDQGGHCVQVLAPRGEDGEDLVLPFAQGLAPSRPPAEPKRFGFGTPRKGGTHGRPKQKSLRFGWSTNQEISIRSRF